MRFRHVLCHFWCIHFTNSFVIAPDFCTDVAPRAEEVTSQKGRAFDFLRGKLDGYHARIAAMVSKICIPNIESMNAPAAKSSQVCKVCPVTIR